ncbi:hypothetical protein [Pleurocapsa sp. PCC 7319]|uniref:hypothetical protein n=1 Tax=Pleurocapsa sp. PCC 7319 TaxID=118161 RepID=UPI00036C48D1
MTEIPTTFMTDEDWINQGKADAWSGKSKQTPEHDPQAASMYDLGYCEGEIARSPVKPKKCNLAT